ncbi:YdcF family protein [Clostridium arbusti]|uniref:YdcF family protein n=1 Tax=Clostridium arbusti TaxID=1137848 RepID=UPI0002889957|nr:YdcF family protein [Clostridium arbusti]
MTHIKNYIFEKFIIILGLLNILYFIVCFLVFKMIVNFSTFFLALGIIFVLLGVLKIKYVKKYKNKIIKNLINIINTFIFLLIIMFILMGTCIAYSAIKYTDQKPDYIMILGAGIRGKNMLLIQRQRTDRALEFIKGNPNIKIIASGGQGPGEDISEAEAMREYLIKHGVKDENIIKEEKSRNTMENMKYTRSLLNNIDDRPNLKIAVVTSNFHVFRAKFLAERAGINAEGISAPVNKLLLPNFSVRECFAIIKSFVMDK